MVWVTGEKCSSNFEANAKKSKGEKRRSRSKRRRREHVKKTLQRTILLVCTMAFVANSYHNMLKYWEGGTVITESWQHPASKKLALPTLTLCPGQDHIDSKSVVDDENLNIEDILLCEIGKKGCHQMMIRIEQGAKIFVNFSEHSITQTRYRGKCFTRNLPKVSEHEELRVLLKNGSIDVYLHEPGEEFFLHYVSYPGSTPSLISVTQDRPQNIIMAMITKAQIREQGVCKDWSREQQIDCMKRHVRIDLEKSVLNCTRPWVNSMLKPNSPTALNNCQNNAYLTLRMHTSIERHLSKTCQTPCVRVKYTLTVDRMLTEDSNNKGIMFQYHAIATKVIQSIPISSFSDGVSDIGGNLGLFLNFSLISVLISLLNKALPPTK